MSDRLASPGRIGRFVARRRAVRAPWKQVVREVEERFGKRYSRRWLRHLMRQVTYRR